MSASISSASPQNPLPSSVSPAEGRLTPDSFHEPQEPPTPAVTGHPNRIGSILGTSLNDGCNDWMYCQYGDWAHELNRHWWIFVLRPDDLPTTSSRAHRSTVGVL